MPPSTVRYILLLLLRNTRRECQRTRKRCDVGSNIAERFNCGVSVMDVRAPPYCLSDNLGCCFCLVFCMHASSSIEQFIHIAILFVVIVVILTNVINVIVIELSNYPRFC